MSKKKLYTKDSIESLSPLEFTRLRPGVYVGSTAYSTQLLVEIVSNSIDEYRLGNGSEINITADKDVFTVEDSGQGFLINEKRDDGTTVLEAAFSVLNTSGKYREDGTYEGTSLGTYGIGSKITVYLSNWLEVTTYRDGQYEKIRFVEGVFDSREVGKQTQPYKTGTTVSWKPSKEFFDNTDIEIDKVRQLLKTTSALCRGLTFNLNYNNSKETFYSKNGLHDLVDDLVKDKEIINNRCEIKFEEDKNKMDFILTYTSDYSSRLVPYVNTGLTERGPQVTQIKTAITREFNKFFRDKKWLKDKDENLTGDDIQEGALIVYNITAPNVSYDAQVKSSIVKIDMSPFTKALSEGLQTWFNFNEKEVKSIADKALAARKAREAAKKAREKVREGNKKKQKALKFDSKLADCYSKDRSKCELYIVEGDSASGNLKQIRNNEFQAVMPIRGKILSVRKATLEKVQKNAEIMTMIEAFGLTADPKTMKLTYDKDDLRYGKIIILSDADQDGNHIKNLFYTFIWTFCPELILDGYIYAGQPPLYRITEGKDKYIYLKDDKELHQYVQANKGNKKYQVGRYKGLGEMSAQETEILVNPSMRTLKQISVSDIKATDKLFDDLMGNVVAPRKEFIKKHSKEANYNE